MLKKIIFGLLIISSLSINLKADDMDPASGILIWSAGSAAATLVGYAGVESYNILTQDTNTRVTNTMDTTITTTDDRD